MPEVAVRKGAFRVFYYTAPAQGVLVFHAFVRTQRTPPLEIELARKRLKELLECIDQNGPLQECQNSWLLL